MSDSQKELLLRAISPNARSVAEVRRDLRRAVRRVPGIKLVPMHDDRDDVEGVLRQLAPELQTRGIVVQQPTATVTFKPPDLTLFPGKLQVRLHFVVTTDIPGVVTRDGITPVIPQLNAFYSGGNIEFLYDPARDFEVVVNTFLDRDWRVGDPEAFAPGDLPLDSTAKPTDEAPAVVTEPYATERQRFAQKYAGKLVIYCSRGSEFRWDVAAKRYVVGDRGWAYSSGGAHYVAMSCYGFSANWLAHEIGHHLHLPHTFGFTPATIEGAAQGIKDTVEKGGATPDNVIAALDGDGAFVPDTPTDFGPALLESVHGAGSACGPKDTVDVKVDFTSLPDRTYQIKFDRTNLMSYFKECPTADRFSVEQYRRMRMSIEQGNRQHLVTGQQTWVPPAPSAASWGAGRLDVFAVGGEANLYHKLWTSEMSYVEGWGCLGGYVTGARAVSWGAGRLDIVARSVKGNVLHKSFAEGSGWAPSQLKWANLGGEVASEPVVVSWAPNRLDLFARGMDGAIWHKAWDGSKWLPSQTGWVSLGGKFFNTPAAVAWGPNRLDIVAQAEDGTPMHKGWDGSKWFPSTAGWTSLGGKMWGSPAICSWGVNRLDIAILGDDHALYYKNWSSSGWSPSLEGWHYMGGNLAGRPSITTWGPNRLDIVARGADGNAWYKGWSGSEWVPSQTGWSTLGGPVIGSPVVKSWGPNRLDIFARGLSGELLHKSWDIKAGWLPSIDGWTADTQLTHY